MMKKITWIVAIIVVIALIATKLMSNKSEMEESAALAQVKNTTVSVVTAKVMKENISMNFTATGNFEPSEELTLSSESAGRIEKIFVDEGDVVTKGQMIAALSKEKIQADIQSAEASLNKSKKDLDRYEGLEPKGGVTKQQLDEVRLNYQNAVSRLKNVKKELSDLDIRATINGVINMVYVENGSYLAAGGKVVDIVNVNTLKMTVKVTESEVINLYKNQKVTVWADVLPNNKINGKVVFIGVKADESLRYTVDIQFNNNSDMKLRAGMFGTAEFTFDKQRQALTIPREAIEGSLKDPKMYLVKDNVAKLKEVTIGVTTDTKVEIIKGVSLNDLIVIDGQINLQDGDSVTVANN